MAARKIARPHKSGRCWAAETTYNATEATRVQMIHTVIACLRAQRGGGVVRNRPSRRQMSRTLGFTNRIFLPSSTVPSFCHHLLWHLVVSDVSQGEECSRQTVDYIAAKFPTPRRHLELAWRAAFR